MWRRSLRQQSTQQQMHVFVQCSSPAGQGDGSALVPLAVFAMYRFGRAGNQCGVWRRASLSLASLVALWRLAPGFFQPMPPESRNQRLHKPNANDHKKCHI